MVLACFRVEPDHPIARRAGLRIGCGIAAEILLALRVVGKALGLGISGYLPAAAGAEAHSAWNLGFAIRAYHGIALLV